MSPDSSDAVDEATEGSSDRAWIDADAGGHDSELAVHSVTVPWSPQSSQRDEGVRESGEPGLSDAARDRLLLAIAKARRWMVDITERRCSFADIARREGCGDRHVRYLLPLAFVSPTVVHAIVDGSAPSDLTVSILARTLPHSWAEQERHLLKGA